MYGGIPLKGNVAVRKCFNLEMLLKKEIYHIWALECDLKLSIECYCLQMLTKVDIFVQSQTTRLCIRAQGLQAVQGCTSSTTTTSNPYRTHIRCVHTAHV